MLLSRSIFLQLIFPFILASGILTFILSMETVYRLIYLIVERGVSVFSVGLLLLYRLPQFLSVTLPLAIVIASVVLMVRLSTDNEIYAMNAIGISYWQIGRPFFFIRHCYNNTCVEYHALAAACRIRCFRGRKNKGVKNSDYENNSTFSIEL